MKKILLLALLIASYANASVVYPPILCSSNGTFYGKAAGVMGCYTPAGGGDVLSPGTAVVGDIATFGDVAGTTLLDSGILGVNLVLLTGNQTIAGIKTLSSAPVLSALTASLPICTSAGKATSSTCTGLIPWADIVTGNNYRLIATGAAGVPAEAAAITASRALASDANGIPVAATTTATELGYVNGVTSAIQTQLNALKVLSFTGFMAGTSPADQIYKLDEKAAFAYTLNTIDVSTSAGTTTLALKINGTNVTGCSAVSVSSTPATGTCTAANAVVAGDQVTLVLSSTSSAANLGFTVKYTR